MSLGFGNPDRCLLAYLPAAAAAAVVSLWICTLA